MKTEKRLTMALSVLVALMMLAVPLASSSNLFVDGGQTNSNGDAPSLGASTVGSKITINLNIENSLDGIDYEKLKTELDKSTDFVYSIDSESNVISAVCINKTASNTLTVNSVLKELEAALKVTDVATDRMAAYVLSWSGASKDAPLNGQTVNANWKLNENYAEVTFNASGLSENTSMKKAYEITTGNISVTFPAGLADAAKGYVVNLATPANEPVYNYVVKASNGNIVKDGASLDAKGDLTLSVTYTFNDLAYGTISINSPIFDEVITFYVAKTTGAVPVAATTYYMVFNALIAEKYLDKVKDSSASPKDVTSLSADSNFEFPLTANEGSCKINSWTNGTENYALNSNSSIIIGSELTLNAEFTTFPVIFMVNGQAQLVDVRYGEFSEASCPFDTAGMTVWVKSDKSIFDFGMSSEALQEELIKSTEAAPLTLIALFSDSTETAYVTFETETNGGYFDADKKIDTIIVPVAKGTTADKIPVPVNPSKDSAAGKSYLFAYWATNAGEYEFKSTNKVPDAGLELTAKFVEYTFTINFFVDDNKYIVLYCSGDLTYDSSAKKVDVSNVAGALYDGKTYLAADIDADLTSKLIPTKAGYQLVQWNDKDGKMMLTLGIDAKGYVEVTNAGFSKISANTDLYAEFDAADYVIIYSGNTAAATNNMIQVGTVGESLNFFSDSTFSNDGYKLKEWNTRPDGKGTSYALGASFTLSGADYDKLSKISSSDKTNVPDGIDHSFTLYAIWEKVGGSGSGSGNNNEGNNDSNTDTYLLAGILVVIIVLILVVAVVLRKKQ